VTIDQDRAFQQNLAAVLADSRTGVVPMRAPTNRLEGD
jgi:hypothetical protein